jgi:ATP-dependent DNA helicase RecG
MPNYNLNTSIAYLKGVGPTRSGLLKSDLGIEIFRDLLHFFPNRYVDKSKYFKINELHTNNAEVQIIGRLKGIKTVKQKRSERLVANFSDDTGSMELVWFRRVQYFKEFLKINEPYVIFGQVKQFNGLFSMPHPDIELFSAHKKSAFSSVMKPIYPSSEKLSNRGINNRLICQIQQNLFTVVGAEFKETLSESILLQHQLISKKAALLNIHFPENHELLSKAIFRLKFEELFFIQLRLLKNKALQQEKSKGFVFTKIGEKFNHFYHESLSFELTNAQKKVLKEIRNDLVQGFQMNRLLQGDVGSGKTVVALLALLMAMDNGFQGCLMAPTEILATQHFNAINEMLKNNEVKVALLTGSTRVKKRREIHTGLEDGTIDILIGTHALIEDKVKFLNLGIAIIDEQHRFGVAQRAKLWNKNSLPPHILVMTATPIPRTLAMSLYGDLSISVIDELPKDRKPIKTFHKSDASRLSLFKFFKEEISKGRQVYIVYPLIQESENMDYKDLMDGYESIARDFPIPQYQVSIVHGKMKPVDKEYEMNRFVKGETNIMVATTVIEVGINVPNASVMVIESAERFGLSQLHQLRGRVGRGANQSYCILMTKQQLSVNAKTRMQTMVNSSDGFEISEVDLRLRGPGNLMGTQQSGVLNLKIANIVKDTELLSTARKIAIEVIKEDPTLNLPKNKNIRHAIELINQQQKDWLGIS